jgi:hypothetical protein
MRWRLINFRWRTAAGAANSPPINDSCEWQDPNFSGVLEEELLDRCQRASRLTC